MVNASERFLRIKQIANISATPERKYLQKNGVIRRIRGKPESKGIVGVCEKTIWVWVKEGRFPKPIKLTPSVTVWRLTDIEAWMTEHAIKSGK